MIKRILGLMLGFLLIGANIFAADGDLIVNGNVGIGTTSPGAKLDTQTAVLSQGTYQSQWWSTNNAGYGLKLQTVWDASGIYQKFVNRFNGTDYDTMTFKGGIVGVGYTNPGSSWANEKLGVMNTSAGTRTTALNLINNSSSTNTAVSLDFTPNINISLARINAVRSDTGGGGTTDFVFSQYKGSVGVLQDYVKIKGDSGNVGIGTMSPVAKLEVASGGSTWTTSGWGRGVQLANANVIKWVKGPTYAFGLGQTGDQLYFIRSTADDNSAAANYDMVISGSGYVGIGTTTPSYQLQLSTNLAAKTATNTWIVTSDSRLKTDIQPYTKGLKEILQINPVNYKYNGKGGIGHTKVEVKDPITGEKKEIEIVDTELLSKTNVGVIAEDIQAVVPESVSSHKGKINEDDVQETDILDFDSHSLTFILINAVKELKAEIDSLNEQIADLKAKVK